MTLPALPYHFHDANLGGVTLGPRNEVTLILDIDEPRQNQHRIHIRFGGITNFSEVRAYFGQLTPPVVPNAYLARVDQLDYAELEPSHAHRLIFQLDLDGYGKLLIRCRNIATRTDDQSSFSFL